MLLHSIGRNAVPGVTNPWIRKYIFPGGYIPSLSEVLPAIERAGLYVTDIEILRLHYADTLRAWRERFMARRDEAAKLYDERFCRMWEFYLAGVGNLVPRRRAHGDADSARQAPGSRAPDPRLHRRAGGGASPPRGGVAAHAPRRGVGPSRLGWKPLRPLSSILVPRPHDFSGLGPRLVPH